MIHVLAGDNFFLRRERLAALVAGREVEHYEGEQLSRANLLDIFQGQSLFGDRAIVIDELSMNKELWDVLPEIEVNDTTIILLEMKPDKRTKTYKWLLKNTTVEQLESFEERQTPQAVQWLIRHAKQQYDITLTKALAEIIVARLGRDQLRLDTFLMQLELVEHIDLALIDILLPLAPSASAFSLFAAALDGDRQLAHDTIRYLEYTLGSDGAYQTLGLIASQAMNLTALVLADGDTARVAQQLGVSPYVLGSLTRHARMMNRQRLASINYALFRADQQMKSTSVNPWLLLETALIFDI